MEYKFKEGQEELPVEERIIEKRGHVIEFSLVQMEHDLKAYDKTLKELIGNRDNKQAIVTNVEMHHPFVKDVPPADQFAIHMYRENLSFVKAFNEKIEQIEKEKAEYIAEVALIKETLPELKIVPSPYVAPADGDNLESHGQETDQPKT